MRAPRFLAFVVPAIAACSVPEKQPASPDAAPDGMTPDPGAPDTMILEAPAEFSPSGSATFSFTSNDPSASFRCSFDNETPVVCSSPYTRTLSDGTHSFSVRAFSASGNGDDTPAEHLWTIDTVAPSTTLTEVPPAADNSTMVRFAFDSAERNVTFDCALDGAAFAPCQSGAMFGPVGDGAHSFAVRARDRAGNVDASPAIHAWSVDTSTPDTQLLDGPSGASNSMSATFSFVSPDAGAGATFECSVDNGTFAPCTSPREVTGLGEGMHTFEVRVRDSVGNYDPTPATRTWRVDLSAPDTTISSGPSGTVAATSASFEFASSDPDSTFTCSLDGGAAAPCTSPFNVAGLGQGSHTFTVAATDPAGNTDPTPATASWTVDTVAPNVTITEGPAEGATSGPRVVFRFTVDEGTAECRLDSGAFAPCVDTFAFNAPAGPHEFEVRAVDDAGNSGSAIRTWTIACAAPDATNAAGLLHFDDTGQTQSNATGGAPATLGSTPDVEPSDPAPTSGRFAGGLAFAAAESDHVAWPAALGASSSFTVELWARPEGTGGALFTTADGRFALRATGAGPNVRFALAVVEDGGGAAVTTSAPVSAAVWHHVVASLAPGMIRLWVDGVRTDAAAQAASPAFDAIRIGSNGTPFSGLIDEVWVSLGAVTDDEAALARYCPN